MNELKRKKERKKEKDISIHMATYCQLMAETA